MDTTLETKEREADERERSARREYEWRKFGNAAIGTALLLGCIFEGRAGSLSAAFLGAAVFYCGYHRKGLDLRWAQRIRQAGMIDLDAPIVYDETDW